MNPTKQLQLVGEIIRLHREKMRLKPKSAAWLAGVGYNTWIVIEGGRRVPCATTLDKMCLFLGITKYSKAYRAIKELYLVHSKLVEREQLQKMQ